MTPPRRPRRGFTLVELMVVVAIVGILAAIAVAKFADLVRKADEGGVQGNLGALRSALSIYYGDMEGQYPTQLGSLTLNGKYLTRVPDAKIRGHHGDPASIEEGSGSGDLGGWFFFNVPGDVNFGRVMVNCTHTDSRGTVWTTY